MFTAALIWGSSFALMKNTVEVFPPNLLLALRFAIACLTLAAVFNGRLRGLNWDYGKKTAIMSVFLYLAFLLQTLGVQKTTPGKNAFLTAIYCVIVPFLYWAFGKRSPTWRNLLAAAACVVGIGLVSLTQRLTIAPGDFYTLLGGFFFAAHLVAISIFSDGKDPALLTVAQFGYCAIFFGVTAWLTGEALPVGTSVSTWAALLYMALFCTALGLLLQIYGQKYTAPSTASLILSLEAVFGVIFSVFLYGEALTIRLILGFVLIFAAVLISELNPRKA
ncbi:MAG: DMT family transporter [Peptococcaceae bacterium]|jgi:drug/metabolite transporter (DMT)-like permease|nr:DMT family transporter [Peptococcaceae bacterium]